MTELASLGLTLATPLCDFWAVIATRMREDKRPACIGIADALEAEHMQFSIGGMMGMMHNDIEAVVLAHGGKAGWLTSIETLTGENFRRFNSSVPDSARLAATAGLEVKTSGFHHQRFEGERLGARLKREGLLHTVVIPGMILDDAITETVDPSNHRLTKKDKSAVLREVWKWLLCEYGFVGSCIVLFKHLAKQLTDKFPKIKGALWVESLGYRAVNGRRMNSDVNIPLSYLLYHPYVRVHTYVRCANRYSILQ